MTLPAKAAELRDEIVAALLECRSPCHRVVLSGDQPDISVISECGSKAAVIEIVRYPLDFVGFANRERGYAMARIPKVWYVDPARETVSVIERRLDVGSGNYGYGAVFDGADGSVRPWRDWLRVTGCELC